MNISAELSLYPLAENYKPVISAYIAALAEYDYLEVRTHALSTEVFGKYEEVMQAIQSATKVVFEHEAGAVLVAKFLNKDRREA